MPRRTLRSLLAVALATGPALALAAPAHAAGTVTVTKKAVQIDVMVGPDGQTPCRVDADLYTPSTATAATPAPAIMMTNGFGGNKAGQAGYATQYAEEGFVTLSYSGLGFGNTTCLIELDDPDWDGKAGSQLLDFLAGTRAAVDGTTVDYVQKDTGARAKAPNDIRVGMIGGSYGGEVQFAIAGLDKRLDAIIPQITWNDLSYSLAPNNTSLAPGTVTYTTPGTEKQGWVSLFFGVGAAQPVTSPGGTSPSTCPGFDPRACTAKAQMDALGYPDADTLALARHASVASYLSQITIPTFLSQGQSDTLFNLQESAATYRALKERGVPVKLLWQYWGHSDSQPKPGELDANADPSATFLGQRYLAWFDKWLRDRPVDTGPEFEYFRDYAYDANASDKLAAATASYGSAAAYPVGTGRSFYLSGTGDLVDSPGAVTSGGATFDASPAATSYSEYPVAAQNEPPTDSPGTFAAFTTAPFTTDVDQVGVPTLDVRLSAPTFAASQSAGPGAQLVLFAKVYDVAPDGSKTLPHRLVSAVRIADVTQPVRLELPGIVHRFAAGHRLQVVLANGDASYKNNNASGPVTVVNDPAAPNVLTVPVVAAADAAPAAVVPEAPYAVLLPLAALLAASAVVRRARRRATV